MLTGDAKERREVELEGLLFRLYMPMQETLLFHLFYCMLISGLPTSLHPLINPEHNVYR